jgi:hypothetical protein
MEPMTREHQQVPGERGLRPARLLMAEEVAACLSVPVSWVRKHGGELRGVVRLGKYIRWNAAQLDQFIAGGGLG